MPEIVGAGAGAGGAGGTGAGAVPGAGSTPGGGIVDNTSGGSGVSDGGRSGPTKISVAFDDGGAASEFSFDDAIADGSSVDGTTDFKFEQLDPLREGEHAELYKTLKAELSAKSRFAKHFKSPEELAQHMDRVARISDFVGKRADGKTGLDAVESTLRELGDMFGKLQSGDIATVEQWFRENPAGMATFTENSLANLAKVDPKLHAALTAKNAVAFLTQKDASGFSAVDAFNAMYRAIPEGEAGAKLRALLDRAAHSLNEMAGQADYKPDQTNLLDQRKAALEKSERQLWNRETDLQADDILRPAAGKLLSALLTKLNQSDLTAEQRQEYRAALMTDFWTEAAKDPVFVGRMRELRKNNDRAGILSLIKENRAKFLQASAKNLYRAKLLNQKGVRKEAAGKAEGATGSVTPKLQAVQYQGKIHPEKGPMVDYDFARMNEEGIEALDRKFYIKGRRELYKW